MVIGWRRGMSPEVERRLKDGIFSKFNDEIPEEVIIKIDTNFSDFVGTDWLELDLIDDLVDYIYRYYLEHVNSRGLINRSTQWKSVEISFNKRPKDSVYGLRINNHEYPWRGHRRTIHN